MSTHPASSLYTPTPIEEAYGVYIYDALFGKFPADGSLHLESKATLRVLQKSEVDSIILKTIWTVVDPDGVKCLTSIAQFHVVLRLIALAQDGLLEQEINRAFNQQRNRTTPVEVFKRTLWVSMDYRDCPLPSFKGVPMPASSLLEGLSSRLRGGQNASSPAPSAMTPVPAPAPAPLSKPISNPYRPKEPPREGHSESIPHVIKIKQNASQESSGIESAIQQIETLGMDSVSRVFE